MAMKRTPLDPMGGEADYEGPKRARATFEALMRITDVPNHLSRSEEVRELDPEGRIASLEGVLHSTIQQRDDLQAVVDQLWAELDRAQ
ncbi:hypothetical protein Taro_053984 [Colocasia esculenta]|uniref:Uncharacterized protein n=1 Tax=Colocasia esculenta TaxID=4460 RepID=A0A843XMJ6_COLES|nr:hypothetical protein [Colocasia esculenta]